MTGDGSFSELSNEWAISIAVIVWSLLFALLIALRPEASAQYITAAARDHLWALPGAFMLSIGMVAAFIKTVYGLVVSSDTDEDLTDVPWEE